MVFDIMIRNNEVSRRHVDRRPHRN